MKAEEVGLGIIFELLSAREAPVLQVSLLDHRRRIRIMDWAGDIVAEFKSETVLPRLESGALFDPTDIKFSGPSGEQPKPGTIVFLKSGSPKMTVSSLTRPNGLISVEWFDGATLHRDAFDRESLKWEI